MNEHKQYGQPASQHALKLMTLKDLHTNKHRFTAYKWYQDMNARSECFVELPESLYHKCSLLWYNPV